MTILPSGHLIIPRLILMFLHSSLLKTGMCPKVSMNSKRNTSLPDIMSCPGSPRVFISQLILSDCSRYIQKVFGELIESVDHSRFSSEELLFSGALSNPPSYEIFNRLREESEYAGWFYIFGFRANHFTVAINSLGKYDNIYDVNELLKKNGFQLNSAGGEVKGTPEDLLQQSSTMADIVTVKFVEGEFEVPACYYEFAQRFPDSTGQLYSGFISKSADKIFESTNFYKKK